MRFKRWIVAMGMAFNQLFNTLTGGNPDEAVSSRAGRARDAGNRFGAGVCHVLDWLDPRDGDNPEGDHCQIAVRNHIERTRLELEKLEQKPKPGNKPGKEPRS